MVDFNPRRMGAKKDMIDPRDFKLFRASVNIDSLPERANCGNMLPEAALDQKETGACTGFSGAIVTYAVMKKDRHRRPFVPSPVFMYRQARVEDEKLGIGSVAEDSGATLRSLWKGANKYGLVPMSNLQPNFMRAHLANPETFIFPEKSVWRREASRSNLADAQRRQVMQYFRCLTLGDMLKSIADGWPVQYGFVLYRSFYDASGTPNYNVPDPGGANDYELGGHAVAAYAYDRSTRRVFFRNSWGPTAHKGKPDFTLSFDYVDKHSMDMWTGRLIEGGVPSGV